MDGLADYWQQYFSLSILLNEATEYRRPAVVSLFSLLHSGIVLGQNEKYVDGNPIWRHRYTETRMNRWKAMLNASSRVARGIIIT